LASEQARNSTTPMRRERAAGDGKASAGERAAGDGKASAGERAAGDGKACAGESSSAPAAWLVSFIRRHRALFKWSPIRSEGEARALVDRVLSSVGIVEDDGDHRLRALLAAGLHDARHLEVVSAALGPEEAAGCLEIPSPELLRALCELETVLSGCEDLAVMFARGRASELAAVVGRVAAGDEAGLLEELTRCFDTVESLLSHELQLRETRGALAMARERLLEGLVAASVMS